MRYFKVWVGIAMVAALVLGITLGNYVLAGSNLIPGSDADPLVSESYIKQAVEEHTTALEYQIFELENQIAALNETVAALEAKIGRTSTSSNVSSSSNQSSSSNNRQSTSSGQSSSDNQSTQSSGSSQSSNSSNSNATSTSSATKTKEVIAQNGVNVRSGPNTSYEIIASIPYGTKVSVISEASGWYEVSIEGTKTGWVYGDLLK